MAVHIGDVHTDVVPAVSPAGQPGQHKAPERIGAPEDAWGDLSRAALTVARRTAAEGFDD